MYEIEGVYSVSKCINGRTLSMSWYRYKILSMSDVQFFLNGSVHVVQLIISAEEVRH